VAEEGGTLVFVEVKTRKASGRELPEAAVTARKRHRVCMAAQHFMRTYRQSERVFRFDVIGLEYDGEDNWDIRHWQSVIDYDRALARRH